MGINGGMSVLKQINDADDAANDLINQNLHAHFQVARRAGLRNGRPDEPGVKHSSGDVPGGARLIHPATGAFIDLAHDPKTGHVKSEAYEPTGFNAYGPDGHSKYGSNPLTDPKDVRSALNHAKKEGQSFMKRESDISGKEVTEAFESEHGKLRRGGPSKR